MASAANYISKLTSLAGYKGIGPDVQQKTKDGSNSKKEEIEILDFGNCEEEDDKGVGMRGITGATGATGISGRGVGSHKLFHQWMSRSEVMRSYYSAHMLSILDDSHSAARSRARDRSQSASSNKAESIVSQSVCSRSPSPSSLSLLSISNNESDFSSSLPKSNDVFLNFKKNKDSEKKDNGQKSHNSNGSFHFDFEDFDFDLQHASYDDFELDNKNCKIYPWPGDYGLGSKNENENENENDLIESCNESCNEPGAVTKITEWMIFDKSNKKMTIENGNNDGSNHMKLGYKDWRYFFETIGKNKDEIESVEMNGVILDKESNRFFLSIKDAVVNHGLQLKSLTLNNIHFMDGHSYPKNEGYCESPLRIISKNTFNFGEFTKALESCDKLDTLTISDSNLNDVFALTDKLNDNLASNESHLMRLIANHSNLTCIHLTNDNIKNGTLFVDALLKRGKSQIKCLDLSNNELSQCDIASIEWAGTRDHRSAFGTQFGTINVSKTLKSGYKIQNQKHYNKNKKHKNEKRDSKSKLVSKKGKLDGNFGLSSETGQELQKTAILSVFNNEFDEFFQTLFPTNEKTLKKIKKNQNESENEFQDFENENENANCVCQKFIFGTQFPRQNESHHGNGNVNVNVNESETPGAPPGAPQPGMMMMMKNKSSRYDDNHPSMALKWRI